MKIEVLRWNRDRDGEPDEAGMRRQMEDSGYVTRVYVYPPGTVFGEHSHDVDKIDAVLSGRFRMVVEGEQVVLTAGDRIHVPRGVRHSAAVVGDEPVVSIDAERRPGPGK